MGIRLILTMIVKNEGPIIERCLESIRGLVDAICITDTGSTDDTPTIIKKKGEDLKIPTHVPTEIFKNFGHNRTISYQNSQKFCQELGWDPKETFVLHLDADMEIKIQEGFKKDSIGTNGVHGYLMYQGSGTHQHPNLRLARLSEPWVCVGRTHEFWRLEGFNQQVLFPYLRIDDHNDGKCKDDKIPRDLRLLEEDLVENPKNDRALFYKAQTLKDSGRYEEAIETYKKKLEVPGWDEELYYSMFMMGKCYEKLTPPNQAEAIFCFLKAYDMRPQRGETLVTLANVFRDRGFNRLAYQFAAIGKQLPQCQDHLFVDLKPFDYELDAEIALSGYYAGEQAKHHGFRACDYLIANRKTPEHISNMAHRQMIHYLPQIQLSSKEELTNFKLPLLKEDKPELGSYRAMNPSIVKTPTGYIVNIRLVNYEQDEKGHYTWRDDSGIIRTKNKLLFMDKGMKILREAYVVDSIGGDYSDRIIGLEDARLVYHKDSIYFTTSTTISRPQPQIALCQVAYQPDNDETDPDISVGKGNYRLLSKSLLIGPKGEESWCEKNWLPYSRNGVLHMIYCYEPFTVLTWNEKSKNVAVNKVTENQVNLSKFRGSAAPIPMIAKLGETIIDGFLSLVHEVHMAGENTRIYSHRFVYHNDKMVPIKTSLPFYFFKRGIEYVCGMAFSHNNNDLIITMGVNDEKAFMVKVPSNIVRQMLGFAIQTSNEESKEEPKTKVKSEKLKNRRR